MAMMDKETRYAIAMVVVMMTVVFTVAFGLKVAVSTQEAKSYRKFCDTPVTTWDAVWLDLRIDECQCDG